METCCCIVGVIIVICVIYSIYEDSEQKEQEKKKKNHRKSDLNCLQENKKTLLPLKSASPFGLALLFTYLALFPI